MYWTNDGLYDLAMLLTDAGASKEYVNGLIARMCKDAGISYPPEQTK